MLSSHNQPVWLCTWEDFQYAALVFILEYGLDLLLSLISLSILSNLPEENKIGKEAVLASG